MLYSSFKLASEKIILNYCTKNNLNYHIFRLFNLFGNSNDSFSFIEKIIKSKKDNKKILLINEGSSIRDFIHCKDVASGMLHLVKNGVTDPVNLGSGSGITIKQIADVVSKRFDKEIVWLKNKPMGDKRRVFNVDRAKSLGFNAQVNLEDGLNETIDWFLENKSIIDERYNVFK